MGKTRLASRYTDASGNYTVSALPDGTYKVWFYNNALNYASEWYDDKGDFDTANQIAVTTGSTTPDINAQLATGATLSGNIYNGSGNGIPDIKIYLRDNLGNASGNASSSDSNGDYIVTGIPAGDYVVLFDTTWSNQNNGTNYKYEYYNNADSFYDAQHLSFTSGQTRSGINAVLTSGGIISGRVTDEDGAGMSGVYVGAGRENGSVLGWSANSDSNGNYQIRGIPAGDYRVVSVLSGYPRKYYDNIFNPEAATLVSVALGSRSWNRYGFGKRRLDQRQGYRWQRKPHIRNLCNGVRCLQ